MDSQFAGPCGTLENQMKPPRARKPTPSKDSGFTLVELLVSASIVLVLTSLVLPAYQNTRERAGRVRCLNNQRQMIQAWTLFANDHGGSLPSNGYVPAGGSTLQPRWAQGYLNPRVAPGDLADEKLLVNAEYAQLAPYLPTASIYHCPAEPSVPDDQAPDRIRSYSMNAYVGWTDPRQRPLQPGYRLFRNWADLGRPGPARLMVFIEVRPESICWPFFGVNMSAGGAAELFAFPAMHHAGGAQIAFADGHIEHHKWRDQRTLQPGNLLFHGHDTPSPDNPDVAWLQSVATSR
jgi:prepilin-type N-terminal cleavage/methylation domain-containing protein/prepilin-type processing-associated H-X9-DG protein